MASLVLLSLQEGAVMATMDHINVVRLYSVCMGKQMMLVSQFVHLGSLLSYIKKNQATLDADSMLNFSKQIADVSMLACLSVMQNLIWAKSDPTRSIFACQNRSGRTILAAKSDPATNSPTEFTMPLRNNVCMGPHCIAVAHSCR